MKPTVDDWIAAAAVICGLVAMLFACTPAEGKAVAGAVATAEDCEDADNDECCEADDDDCEGETRE